MRPARIWFDTPGVRWRVILTIVGVATLLVTLWLSYQRELWTAQEVVVAVAPRLAAPASAASAPRRVTWVAPAASLPAVARPAPPARSLELCGTATVAPGDAGVPDEATAQALERRAREKVARWLAGMQTSGDERARAAGWLLGLARDGVELRDRLATLAAASRDPLVQAYALRACRGESAGSSACQALSPQNWARLETDNGAAWLAVAADPRVEPAGQLEALQQAARASRYDTHAAALHALVQAAAPAGINDFDRLTMARDVSGARADWLGTEALRVHCSATAVDDTSRAQVCDRIAELLATHAQAVPDLLQAREIGLRLDWPEKKLDALRDEADALVAFERRSFESGEPLTCAALARHNAFFADVGRLGEVAALRQALQRAPK